MKVHTQAPMARRDNKNESRIVGAYEPTAR